MKRILLILILCALPVQVWAAAITSTQSGNWSATGTWIGGVVPGNGDTAVINHAVTVDTNTIIGTDDVSGTVAITVSTGKTLVINAQLKCRGNLVQQRSTTVTVGAGAELVLDSPAVGKRYLWTNVNVGTGLAVYQVSGSSGNLGIVNGDGGRGGDKGQIALNDANTVLCGDATFNYARLKNLGDSTHDAMFHGFRSFADTGIRLSNSIVQSCGRIWANAANGDSVQILDYVDFRSPVGTVFYFQGVSDKTTGTRRIKGVTVYSASTAIVQILSRDMAIGDETTFGMYLFNVQVQMSTNAQRSVLKRIFSVSTATDNLSISNTASATLDNAVFFSSADNPHYLPESATSSSLGSNTYSNIIFDADGVTGSDSGDCLQPYGPVTLTRAISINKAGTLVTNGRPSATAAATITNCTSHNSYGAAVGESAGYSTYLPKLTNNLFVNQADGVHQNAQFVALDSGSLIDYNAFWNMSGGYNYDHPAFPGVKSYFGLVGKTTWIDWWVGGPYGSPSYGVGTNSTGRGQHDVNADPQFVDATRTVRKWFGVKLSQDVSAWTMAQLAAQLVRANGYDESGVASTPVPDMTVADCISYISAGFTPQNSLLDGTGEGGLDIGAVSFSATVNGICGTNSGSSFDTITSVTSNNCSAGTVTGFTGSGPWSWSCAGIGGGSDSGTCSASINQYAVTPSAGANGIMSPDSPVNINYGATTSFIVTPSASYVIDSVSGCGGALVGSTFTTAAITGNCTVTASFLYVDTTPPVTTADKAAGRYTTSQTVTLSSNETATIKYCLTAGCTPGTTYSAPFKTLQNIATQTLRYQATDTAGNVEAVKEVVLRKQRKK